MNRLYHTEPQGQLLKNGYRKVLTLPEAPSKTLTVTGLCSVSYAYSLPSNLYSRTGVEV